MCPEKWETLMTQNILKTFHYIRLSDKKLYKNDNYTI